MNLEVTAAFEESHIGDTCSLLLGPRLTCGCDTVIEICHCVTITIVSSPIDHILELFLNSRAAFLLTHLAGIVDLLLECTHDTAKHVKHGQRTG